MKKAVWIAAAVVLVLITVFCVLYFTQEDYTFYCGLEEFGGPEEVTHPTLCDIEEAKLDKYFPLCIELVEGTEHSYEKACAMVLLDPTIICRENIVSLGLDITEEECLEKLNEIEIYTKKMKKPQDQSRFAIASLILGIAGLLITLIPSILAIIFGVKALSKKGKYRKIAIAGIVLGVTGIVLAIVVLSIFGGLLFSYFRGEEKIKEALSARDASVCNRISVAWQNNKCITEVAVMTGDPTICEKQGTVEDKDLCYRQVAIENSDESLCGLITDNYYRDSCIRSIGLE